ncbi:MAG TPA: FecR family protein [Bordetella sp.]
MTASIDPDTLQDPRDAAAYWFARERSGHMDEAERQDFENWRCADPEHDLEYRRAKGIWHATLLIPQERLRTLAREPQRTGAALYLPRRRLVFGLGAACAAAVAAAVALPELDSPTYSDRFATGHGERRQVALPDDSLIDLNTDTSLAVHFYAGRRVVELAAGEAAFSVARNADRPFSVHAGDTVVRVTGTRFDVRRDGKEVLVAVESGSVEVKRGPWWRRSTAQLGAGQTAQTRTQGLATTSQADVESLLAWRHGRLVFQDTPLSQAIAEINRYAPHAIQLNDAALARVRIAGVFSTDDTQPFLDLLPTIAPVRVLRLPDGTPVVARR